MKIKDLLQKTIVRDILINLIYLILIIVYFLCFNTQATTLGTATLVRYIDISSLIFLLIAIIMFEVGYRNDKAKIFINGIEFFVLAILTLFIKHLPKVFGYTMKTYTEVVMYAFVAYYILKSAITYTKMEQEKLKKLSDIKEIVKEEPTKKTTKRKNKKVEEGK